MSKPQDDLDAVRQIVSTLEDFAEDDRERILRWAREKLGMAGVNASGSLAGVSSPSAATVAQVYTPPPPSTAATFDIKSFITQKDPKNDTQLAAAVAYYYQFHAPAADHKDAISKEDLVDACRKADRRRPVRPAQTLVNAFADGVLDKVDRGRYRINSVGENLVAMVLPAASEGTRTPRKIRPAAVKKSKKSAPKKPSVKKK